MNINNQHGKIDEYQYIKGIGSDVYQIFETRYLDEKYILCKGQVDVKDYMDDHGEFNEKGKRVILNYHDSVEEFKKVFENEDEDYMKQDFAGMCFSETPYYNLEHRVVDMDLKEAGRRFAEAFEKNELAKCFEEMEQEAIMIKPSLNQKLDLAKEKQTGFKKESEKFMANEPVR